MGDDGFIGVTVAEVGGVEDGTKVLERIFIIRAGEEFGVMSATVFGFLNLEGEPGTRALASDGEGRISSENELFGVNHGKTLTEYR